jgi:hypothetical protein
MNFNPSYRYESDWDFTLVKALAKCIPTVRVVKIVDSNCNLQGFWSINRANVSENEGDEEDTVFGWQHVSYVQWGRRQATVMRDEMLEQLDCQDTWFQDS